MKKLGTLLLIVTHIVSFSSEAFAVGSTGFENATFSAESLAQANAVVAQGLEPAAISYNPAGITQLEGIQAQANIAFINMFTIYHSDSQSNTRSTATISPVPTAYITINPGELLGDRVTIGVGSDSPFGLSRKYSSIHPATRYTGYDAWFKMYTIKPVMAVKLHEKLSVGAGPMYYDVFDFGGVQKYPNLLLGGPFPDGQVRANLSGHAWGWHMGILAKPHEQHHLGFYFRSPVTVHTSGLIKVENATVGGNFETGGKTKVDLPLNFTWAYAYKPTEKTTLEVDFGFTRWAAHKRLYIDAAPVNPADDAILAAIGRVDKDWRNSFAIQLGANHQLTDKFKMMGGFYWMTAAVPKTHFLPSVPDANRLAFSLGAGYQPSENWELALAYLIAFNLRRRIDNNAAGNEAIPGSSVDGTYYSVIQDFVLSATYKWDPPLFSKTPKGTKAA